MSTVMLLGAGASRASEYELPVMNEFFVGRDLQDRKYSDLLGFIQSRFGAGCVYGKLNLEEVITHLHLGGNESLPGGTSDPPRMQLARKELDEYMVLRFAMDPSKKRIPAEGSAEGVCSYHKKLFKSLREEDSVLTLNYDLVADYALQDVGGRFWSVRAQDTRLTRTTCFVGQIYARNLQEPCLSSFETTGKGYYLKLHGSIDWFCCPALEYPNHTYFYEASPQTGVPEERFCKLCGRNLVRALIPPTLGKTAEEFPKIKAIWSLAYRKLREASKWIVIGVSLTPSDYFFRAMLREARATKEGLDLDVANPCAEHRKNVIEVIQPTNVRESGGLREYVDGQFIGSEHS